MGEELAALALVGIAVLTGLLIVVWNGVAKLRRENTLLWTEIGRLTKRLNQERTAAPPRPASAPPAATPPPAPAAPPVAPVSSEARDAPEPEIPPAPAPPRPALRGAAVVAPALPTPPRERSPREGRPGLEAFVGGRVLLVVGIVVVLAGLGFLLKLAIDRGWIGPAARVAIGSAAGIGALFGGDVLRRRGFGPFGHALMGGGLGALYLCVYFATVRYGFLGLPAGYTVTAALTAAGAWLALRRNAVLLAYLGFLGGYLAPGFLGWTAESLPTLTAWLVVLHLGVAGVLWRRRWSGLDFQALAASVLCFAVWYDRYMAPEQLATAVTCAGLLTLSLLVVALLPSVTSPRRAPWTALATALATGVAAVVAGHVLLFPEHRYGFGAALLLLAAVYALGAWLRVRGADKSDLDAEAFTAFAVAAAATAIPVFFSGHAVAPALAFAGLAACVAGARRNAATLGAMGAAMIALAVCDLVAFRMPPHDGPFVAFVNGVFWSFAAPCVAAVLAGVAFHASDRWKTAGNALVAAGVWLYVPVLMLELWQYFAETFGNAGEMEYGPAAACAATAVYAVGVAWMLRSRPVAALVLPLGPLLASLLVGLGMIGFSHDRAFIVFANPVFLSAVVIAAAPIVIARFTRRIPARVLVLAGLAVLFLAVTFDIYAWADEADIASRPRAEMRFRAHVFVSVAWALYGGALIAIGFMRRRAYLRWAGLFVFGITLLKVVLADMAQLDIVYRVGSFLVLGVLLVAASFLYQRARRQEAEAAPSPGDEEL